MRKQAKHKVVMRTTRTYPTASAAWRADGDVGYLTVRGVATPATAAAIVLDLSSLVTASRVYSVCADWRDAVLAFDPLRSLLQPELDLIAAGSLINLPVSMAVRPGCVMRFFDYSDQAARSGLCRWAFHEIDVAEKWAIGEATVHAYWPGERELRKALAATSMADS